MTSNRERILDYITSQGVAQETEIEKWGESQTDKIPDRTARTILSELRSEGKIARLRVSVKGRIGSWYFSTSQLIVEGSQNTDTSNHPHSLEVSKSDADFLYSKIKEENIENIAILREILEQHPENQDLQREIPKAVELLKRASDMEEVLRIYPSIKNYVSFRPEPA